MAQVEFWCAVYRAEFGQRRPIGAPATLGPLLIEIGVEPEPLLARAVEDANKAALKAQTARAMALGLPGAPCLTTPDGEVFWGNDRLEQSLNWARAHNSAAGKERA